MKKMRDKNKFRGCIIGGAAGDALGYAVEFMSADSIFEKYGNKGIVQYELRNGIAEISDDTQMSMFTAVGLLIGKTRGMTRGICGSPEMYMHFTYTDWYKTQTLNYPLSLNESRSWLTNDKRLFHRRAPGNTCLNAIANGCNGTIEEPLNQSKGCGGIMRVAPIGIYFTDRKDIVDTVDLIGAKAAALTHGHELGYIPSAALVHLIFLLSSNPDITVKSAVKQSMAAMKKLFPKAEHLYEMINLVEKALKLAEDNIDDLAAISQLGGGWVAEETLAIAVYCSVKYSEDFDKALIVSVNHDGDSDSTGAVTGNILGTYLGYDKIPDKYKDHLELSDILLELSDDLCNDCKISEYSSYRDDMWSAKYIYGNYCNRGDSD